MSWPGFAGSAWLFKMSETTRALGFCGNDGELMPLAYWGALTRKRSVPAWPHVGCAILLPDPSNDSTVGAAAGAAAVADKSTRGSSTSAACCVNCLGLRRRARIRFSLRLRFIVGSPSWNRPGLFSWVENTKQPRQRSVAEGTHDQRCGLPRIQKIRWPRDLPAKTQP